MFLLEKLEILSILFYVAMGWLCIIAFKPIMQVVPKGMIIWFLIGGAYYTLGVIFYVWEKIPYNHAIWHLFVLGGSISHFFGILFYLVPKTN